MKVKNINPVEKHAEKGILALCILAAGYLGYSALSSPIMFTDPTTNESAAVKDVENQITNAVDKMNKMREDNRANVERMVNPWKDPINPNRDNNLSPEILAIKYPPFSLGQNIGGGGPIRSFDNGPTLKIVAEPLAPAAPLAEAMDPGHFIMRQNDANSVGTPGALPGPGAEPGVAAGPTPEIREIKPVKITANYDLKGNFANMNGDAVPPGKGIPPANRIDPDLTKNRVVYVGVDVQRAEINPDQNASEDWKDLPKNNTEKLPVVAWNPDTAKDASLDAIHPFRGVILEPRFYQSTTAPVAAPEAPSDNGLLPLIPTAPTNPPGGGRALPPPGTIPPTTPTTPTTPAPGAATTPAVDTGPVLSVVPPPAVLDEATAGATVPIVAYDQTAKPGKQYKYRMRVEIYNPAYHAEQKLDPKQGDLNNQPLLISDWSPASAVFTMEPDQTFYVAGVRQWMATFKIWQLINAKWQHTESDVPVGDVVNDPKDPAFSTEFLVVDSMPGRVVLMNTKDGKLEVRDVNVDKKAADKRTEKDKDQETLDAVPVVPKPVE